MCDYHLIPEHSTTPKGSSLPPSPVTPLPPPHQPLTTRNPLFVSGYACSGHFPSMESHTVCPSVSASLTEHRGLQVHPRGASLLFRLSDALVCGGTTWCLSIIRRWVFGPTGRRDCNCDSCCQEHSCSPSVWTDVPTSLWEGNA